MEPSRILVVEDEAIIAKEIEYTLRDLGYDVVASVPTGEEAVTVALAELPDLVLMDIMLPGDMDGAEAAAIIRQQTDIPIVFSSAYTDEETVDRVKPVAPYGYLIKPFDHTELRIVVETALYKSRLDRKLRESEARLRQAQKMEAVGRLSSGIAHDFNNILSAIIGYSEMGLNKVDNGDTLYRMFDRIHRAGRRAKNLVQLLLDFSRPASLDHDPTDLRATVEEAIQMLKSSLPQGVDLQLEGAGRQCMVKADPTQLHQVAMNLLVNAVDAMKESGGTVSVALRHVCASEEDGVCRKVAEAGRRCVLLSVSDTGCGISEEMRDKVFEPFFTTKAAGEGTGMGLAIVHGVVRSYGGFIDLSSTPSEGTTVSVCLPEASL